MTGGMLVDVRGNTIDPRPKASPKGIRTDCRVKWARPQDIFSVRRYGESYSSKVFSLHWFSGNFL